MERLIVTYELQAGGAECIGHALLAYRKREKPQAVVNKYFREFYGEKNLDEAPGELSEYFLYLDQTVSVKIIRWEILKPKESVILEKYIGLEYIKILKQED